MSSGGFAEAAGFNDATTTATGILIKQEIRSPNYVPGVSGWAIFKNGNVEFNSGVFRGTVTAGTFAGTDFVISPNGIFLYNGTPGAGNPPILSAVPTGVTTDPYGNTIKGTFALYGASGQAIVSSIVAGVATTAFLTGAAEELNSANTNSFISNPGVSEVLRWFINGPQGSVHNDRVGIFLSSAAKDGSLVAGGSLYYEDTSGVTHLPGNWGPTGFRMSSGNAGDTNVYQGERLTLVQNGTVLINTTAFTGLAAGFFLGVGQYVFEGQVMISPTIAGGTAGFEFAGGGGLVVGSSGLTFEDYIFGTPYTPGAASFVDPALGSVMSTGTLTAGRRLFRFRGTFNVTTAGTCQLFATEAGGGSYNVNSRTSTWTVTPVGP